MVVATPAHRLRAGKALVATTAALSHIPAAVTLGVHTMRVPGSDAPVIPTG